MYQKRPKPHLLGLLYAFFSKQDHPRLDHEFMLRMACVPLCKCSDNLYRRAVMIAFRSRHKVAK